MWKTGELINEWNRDDLWSFRSELDDADDIEINRNAANERYEVECVMLCNENRTEAGTGIEYDSAATCANTTDEAADDEDELDFYNFIEETAMIAERMEIYLRRGAADESILIEHKGYDILATYHYVRDILQRRAIEDNLNYEGFRDLASRAQDYAKIHPLDTDLPDSLVWTPLPAIRYRDASTSKGYKKSFWRLLQLGFVGYLYDLQVRNFKRHGKTQDTAHGIAVAGRTATVAHRQARSPNAARQSR